MEDRGDAQSGDEGVFSFDDDVEGSSDKGGGGEVEEFVQDGAGGCEPQLRSVVAGVGEEAGEWGAGGWTSASWLETVGF